MKRVLIALFCIMLFAGCAVTQKTEELLIPRDEGEAIVEGIRMLKIDGELYYDSGKDSSMVPRCGTMAGSLKTVGTEFEIPQNDNECNFEPAKGFQNATNMTKEIPIDGEWRIFRKIVDPEKDFSGYTHCFHMRGKLPNAAAESEYIVLAKEEGLTFERVARSLFSSNSNDWLDCYVIPVLQEDEWGLRLFARNVTPKGLSVVFEQFGGNAQGELLTGDWYILEVQNSSGGWTEVKQKEFDNPVVWHSIAYKINENEQTEKTVDWQWLYGELEEGHYRIGKEVTEFKEAGVFDKKVYYADFFID